MFEIGEKVLVFLVSGYCPAVYAGTVVKTLGYAGAELSEDTVMVAQCPGGEWGKLAEGDKQARAASQYRKSGRLRFSNHSRIHSWIGELPKVN